MQEKEKRITLNGQEMEPDDNGQYVEVKKETASRSWFTPVLVGTIICMVVLIFVLPPKNHTNEVEPVATSTPPKEDDMTLAELKGEWSLDKEATQKKATPKATQKGTTSKAKRTYALVVRYVYKSKDGAKVHPDTRLNLQEGELYDILIPTLKDLTTNKTAVRDVMGAQDKEVTVVYTDAKDKPSNDPLNDPANSGNAMVGGGDNRDGDKEG